MRCARILTWIVAVALGAAVSVAQETTGRMMVRTIDGDQQPLGRVSVTIDSPSQIGGDRTAATDDRGEASFLRLAPGVYRVQARLDGFATQERREVVVRLGGLSALTLVLPEARFAGEITVADETPVVDPAQVGTEQTFDAEFLQRTAIGPFARYCQFAWAFQTPGTIHMGIFGSMASENAWFIDGVDTTAPASGGWGPTLSFDAVQEIEVKTGGYEAEFGRALGGVISVVTKSGGNQFSGSLDVRYVDDAFQEDGEYFDGELQEQSRLEIGATIGGPIRRDRLWFFVSATGNEFNSTPFGAPTTIEAKITAPSAKLTWQASPSWRIELMYLVDKADTNNFNSSQFVAAEAVGSDASRQDVGSMGVGGMLSDSLLWTMRVGADRSDYVEQPTTGDLESISHLNLTTERSTGNHPSQQYGVTDRRQAATDLSWFVGGPVGSHEVKAGLQYTDTDISGTGCLTGTPGGARCEPGVSGLQFWDTVESGVEFPLLMWEVDPGDEVDLSGDLWAVYAQDTWRPIPRLSAKLGLRYDRVSYDNDVGERVADMGLWQPRIGLAWDLSGDAKNLLRGSVGRFMDPNTFQLPMWASTSSATQYRWTSCSFALPQLEFDPSLCQWLAGAVGLWWRDDPEGWDPHGWFLDPVFDIIGGAGATRVDPDLRAAYSDQLVLGYERELWPRTSVELSYVHKRSRQLFEDTCGGNIPEPSEGADCGFLFMTNLPQLRRNYEAVIVSFESRGFGWLTMRASYTYAESTGNQNSNNSDDFDIYPWHFENRFGYLQNHYRHNLRIHGYVLLPYDLILGFNADAASAWRWTPVADSGDIPEMPLGQYFVEPRGNREGYSWYQLDLQFSKGFRLASRLRLELILSALNVFSTEHPSWVCDSISGCGDYQLGDPTDWQTPRSWQVGVRFEF